MLLLDACNYRVDGELGRRAAQLRKTESLDGTARVLAHEFNLMCSHRTIVRWIAAIELDNRNARAAREKSRDRKRRAS